MDSSRKSWVLAVKIISSYRFIASNSWVCFKIVKHVRTKFDFYLAVIFVLKLLNLLYMDIESIYMAFDI